MRTHRFSRTISQQGSLVKLTPCRSSVLIEARQNSVTVCGAALSLRWAGGLLRTGQLARSGSSFCPGGSETRGVGGAPVSPYLDQLAKGYTNYKSEAKKC